MAGTSSKESSERSSHSSVDSSSRSGSGTSSGSSEDSDDSRSVSSGESARELAEAKKADQIFGRTSSVTGTMGYARLSSAGKATVDHIVRKRVNIIGRTGFDADCQIRSDSKLVSRRHACLFWNGDADQWAIKCLSEKNGMLVDGTPIVVGAPPILLRSKNLIEIGDAAFFFLEAASPTVRTAEIAATEALVVDLRLSRKKKRHSGMTASTSQHRKRGRIAPSTFIPSKQARLKGRKKQRNAAADVETDDSSYEDEVPPRKPSVEKVHVTKKRLSKGTPPLPPVKSLKTSSSPLPAEEEVLSPKREDPPLPRSVTKRKLGVKKRAGAGSTPSKVRKSVAARESPGRSMDGGVPTPQKYRDDWNKKEKTDFGRALFAVGVDTVALEDGSVGYDWARFRVIAELPKKSDDMLASYYERLMHDVETLLEEEEREKRTKGPRTKHKPGCDCVVCENTRKSRRKKREENNPDGAGESSAAAAPGDEDDEAAVKSTGRTEDRLVGLVTAQKLRVRMGIHEAARQVHSEAGEAVIQKMSTQSHGTAAHGDLPSWWVTGKHDRALMVGSAKHGVGLWEEIWKDDNIEEFAMVQEELGDEMVWPTPQVAMKRLREVASSINAEIRRLTKREARQAAVRAQKGEDGGTPTKGDKGKSPAKGKGKGKGRGKGKGTDKGKGSAAEKGTGKTTKGKGKGKAAAKKKAQLAAKHRSAYKYNDGAAAEAPTLSEGSMSRGSTQEDSDGDGVQRKAPVDENVGHVREQVEAGEDDDEIEIEVEEEEEVEVEVMEYADEAEPAAQQAQPVETDEEDGDEDDDEDKVEFETASESGSD